MRTRGLQLEKHLGISQNYFLNKKKKEKKVFFVS
jgi:hypothetical protein